MKRIIEENNFQKVVENEDGTVSIFEKQKGEIKKVVQNESGRTKKKPEKGYWVPVPEKWWRGALQGLKPIERCILISLLIAGAKKPNHSQLARELITTRWTIIKYLKILKKKGFL